MLPHTVFSLPFILIAMFVSAHGIPNAKLLILGIFAAFFARNFAMSFNRFVDRKFDIKNPRTAKRPSVDGSIGSFAQLSFIVANAVFFIITAYIINKTAFALSFVFLPILAAYSYFKRFSASAHLVLGLSLALAPLAGEIAVHETISVWNICLSGGVLLWVAGFDVLYALQDMEFDTREGLHSIPSLLGKTGALNASLLFHCGTVLLWGGFVYSAHIGLIGSFGVLLAAALLMYEHRLVRHDIASVNTAFFTVNGYLGILFFILIAIDVWSNR